MNRWGEYAMNYTDQLQLDIKTLKAYIAKQAVEMAKKDEKIAMLQLRLSKSLARHMLTSDKLRQIASSVDKVKAEKELKQKDVDVLLYEKTGNVIPFRSNA